jgi:hypothetical protein
MFTGTGEGLKKIIIIIIIIIINNNINNNKTFHATGQTQNNYISKQSQQYHTTTICDFQKKEEDLTCEGDKSGLTLSNNGFQCLSKLMSQRPSSVSTA